MKFQPADRLSKVEEYYFSRKLEEIARMRAQGIDVVNLGIGSPDLRPPESALEAASAAITADGNHGYAAYRSSPELRQAIAIWYAKTYSVELNAEREVLPLLGSKEGIFYLSLALLNPGDSVLFPNPGYPAYASVAKLLGVTPIPYSLKEENHWQPDIEELESFDLGRCKLMWINYPHMPTGQAASVPVLQSLIGFARDHGLILANDNPYGLILNKDPPLSLLHLDEAKEICVELNSMSKSFSMAGWRVGMLLGHADLVDAVVKVKSNVDSGMFLAVQKGAIEALSAPPAWHEMRNEIYAERRELVWKILDTLGFHYEPHQVGLFVWAKVPPQAGEVEALVDHLLKEAHVFITPGTLFGSEGKGHVRVSLCAPKDRLELALHRVREFTQ